MSPEQTRRLRGRSSPPSQQGSQRRLTAPYFEVDGKHPLPQYATRKQRVHLVRNRLALILRHPRQRDGRDAAVAAVCADLHAAIDAAIAEWRQDRGEDGAR